MAYTITNKGQLASRTTQNLVTVQLPKLAVIKRLRAGLAEHERLLYEYYSTTNRTLIWPKIKELDAYILEYLINVLQSFENRSLGLTPLFSEIQHIRNILDVNLNGESVDWDQARFELANLTLTREKAEKILSELTQSTQDDAWQEAESTQDQISTIVDLVLIFTAIIIICSMFIGFYTQANIRKTAKRRALALFPERNPNPVLSLGWNGEILFCNPACNTLLSNLDFKTDQIDELLPSDFLKNLKLWQKSSNNTFKFQSDIKDRHLHYNLSLLPDLGSCHLYIEDVTDRKKAQDQIKYQALHDVHTGMPNRRQFESHLTSLINDKVNCSTIFISIDRFKFITSSQGYNIGDLIIKHMGHRLIKIFEMQSDSIQVYRLEGSTFCVQITTPFQDTAQNLALSIQSAMDEPLSVNEHRYYLTLSMGICHYPQDGNTAQDIITNGNAALNNARIKGDSCEVYSPILHANEQSWLPIDAGMRQALEKDEFLLHYQAKVDSQTTQVKGAEALIRWQGNDGVMVSPGMFIPVAEQTGLIIKIGQWVIEEACRQARSFEVNNQDIQLAINISARQFQHRHFLSQLKTALTESQADPTKIELEITESLIMENAEQSIKIMKQLKDMGFALAIDDFGTGYSSLSYLKQFPIDTLKVDQAFIKNLEHDDNDQSIVKAIIDLAKHLDLKTVAEGVETQGQWHFLKDLECDYIQGFLFSKPDIASKLLK